MSASDPSITEQGTQASFEKKPILSGQYTKGENPNDEEESLDIELLEMSASDPSITEQGTQAPFEKKPRHSGQYTEGENPNDEEESLDIELLENFDYVIFCDSDYDEDDPVFELSCIEPSDGFHKYKDFVEFVIKEQELKGYCYKNVKLLKVVIANADFCVVNLQFEAYLDGVSMTCRAKGIPGNKHVNHLLYWFTSERTPKYTDEDKVYAEQALWIKGEAFDALDIEPGPTMSSKTMLEILRHRKFYITADEA